MVDGVTLRAAGFAVDNGADLSEVLLTAAAIPVVFELICHVLLS
jgi:hypothetical protein